MKALLVVNPAATTTTLRTRKVLSSALAGELKLQVAVTEHQGHAYSLGRTVAGEGDVELVIAHGGDGTVNELVNGLLHHGPTRDGGPRLAVIPGGSTNVFARALGIPNNAVEATGALLDSVRKRRERSIGLGLASGVPGTADSEVPSRWFTFCAGLGLIAGVVGRVEQQRERGRRSTHSLYIQQLARQFAVELSKGREGSISAKSANCHSVTPMAMSLVCNTAPWTYLGNRPLYALPGTSFEAGLDLIGLDHLSFPAAARLGLQFLTSTPNSGVSGKHVLGLHDLADLTLHSKAPVPFQVDGDHLGVRTDIRFTSIPDALRVIA
ncbi:diacylglycerol kinase family protein [Streptomyces sp. or20]|uniref:diacylglycerol/lipid kinase family protein n=1 Tax=Streptomyces sp. or20 TaxID=1828016 RepID=UPI000BF0859D|nr:diacylglycerol kinase family protein [Streptomyces sp. or20]